MSEYFASIKDYVGFTDEDTARLRELAAPGEPYFQEFSNHFYERIARHPDAHRVFSGQEQIERLNQGKTTAEGRAIDFNVLAPVDGHVIEIVTRQEAPVVSSSSFGSGSVLVVLADLDRLLFIGTVDEIDVRRLKVGMQATIQVGALPVPVPKQFARQTPRRC